MVASQVTTVPIFTADQWAARIMTVYPNQWTSDQAKVAGGILYSLFNATAGSQLAFTQASIDWALKACRIATAQDTALDAIAEDYFGSVAQFEATVVRQIGEDDDTFRERIYANLLQGGGTNSDISRVVELLTGQAPRIIEPWNLVDTAACDAVSFLDIDTPANPCRLGDQNFPFQGLLESILPPYGAQGNNPVYGLDNGLACDRSFIIDPEPTWFLGEKELDIAINRVRMANTIVWRSYQSMPTVSWARGGSAYPGAGAAQIPISMSPACAQPLVILASAGWNSRAIAVPKDYGNFYLAFSESAPGGRPVDWIAAPATLAGFGALYLQQGAPGISLTNPIPGQRVLVTPNWDTNVLVTSLSDTDTTYKFTTPAPPGGILYYGSFPRSNSGVVSLLAEATAVEVPFPVDLSIVNGEFQVFVDPSWNTDYWITKLDNGFIVDFSEPPQDGNQYFVWGAFSSTY